MMKISCQHWVRRPKAVSSLMVPWQAGTFRQVDKWTMKKTTRISTKMKSTLNKKKNFAIWELNLVISNMICKFYLFSKLKLNKYKKQKTNSSLFEIKCIKALWFNLPYLQFCKKLVLVDSKNERLIWYNWANIGFWLLILVTCILIGV